MSDEAYAYWAGAIARTYASPEWKAVMARNGLAPLDLTGPAFEAFVADSVAEIAAISREIGIIK